MYAVAVIDSLKFAREGDRLSGKVQISTLVRLKDALHDDRGKLEYAISGGSDAHGEPVLELKIGGVLHLQCQRCLELLEHTVDHDTVLRLATADCERDDDPDAPDWIEASSELDVNELIEDELLLVLPAHPRHPIDVCRGNPALKNGQDGRSSVFARLTELKVSKKSLKE